MFKNSIKSRVMKVISQKLEDAQELHNQHCEKVDEDTKVAHKNLDAQAEASKNGHLEILVSDILAKIL